MKKVKYAIPFAVAMLLIGCGANSTTSSKDESSSSSSSENPPVVTTDVTFNDLTAVATTAKEVGYAVNGGNVVQKSFYSSNEIEETYEFGYGYDGPAFHVVGVDDIGEKLDTYTLVNNITKTYDPATLIQFSKYADGTYGKVKNDVKAFGYKFDKTYSKIDIDAYTAEDLLINVIAYGKDNVNSDFVASKTGSDITFSFGYYDIDDVDGDDYSEDFMTVKASLTTDSIGVLTKFDVSVTSYTWTAFTYDSDSKKITLKDNAKEDENGYIKVTQTVGDRTYFNTIVLDDFYFDSFKLYDEDNNVIGNDGVKIKKGTECKITLDDIAPVTANSDFDDFDVTVTYGYNSVTTDIDVTKDGNSFTLNPNDSAVEEDEAYIVRVTTFNCDESFVLTVLEPDPESINFSVYYYSNSPKGIVETYGFNASKEFSAVVGNTYYFGASVDPSGASQDMKVTYKKEGATSDTEISSESISYIDDWSDSCEKEGVYKFTPSEEGKYTLTFTSNTLNTVTDSFVVNAAAIDYASVISGAYNDENERFTFDFALNADNKTGNVIITYDSSEKETATFVLSDGTDAAIKEFTFANTDNTATTSLHDNFKMIVGCDGNLYIYAKMEDGGYASYANKLTAYNPAVSALAKEGWTGTYNLDGTTYTFTLDLYEDGTTWVVLDEEENFDYRAYNYYNWSIDSELKITFYENPDYDRDDGPDSFLLDDVSECYANSDLNEIHISFTVDDYYDLSFTLTVAD